MWVRFTADFDWKPKPQVTIAFLAGQERNVTRGCASKAIKAGKAEKMEPTHGKKSGSRQP